MFDIFYNRPRLWAMMDGQDFPEASVGLHKSSKDVIESSSNAFSYLSVDNM